MNNILSFHCKNTVEIKAIDENQNITLFQVQYSGLSFRNKTHQLTVSVLDTSNTLWFIGTINVGEKGDFIHALNAINFALIRPSLEGTLPDWLESKMKSVSSIKVL